MVQRRSWKASPCAPKAAERPAQGRHGARALHPPAALDRPLSVAQQLSPRRLGEALALLRVSRDR
eukprot:11222654-Lingulodinium_polyedra.AAC.1